MAGQYLYWFMAGSFAPEYLISWNCQIKQAQQHYTRVMTCP